MTLEIPPVIAKREMLSAVVTPEKKQSKKKKRGGDKKRRGRKNSRNKTDAGRNPGFYEKESLYITQNDETPNDVVKSVHIVGGVTALVKLNNPYFGTTLRPSSKLKRGTLLRVNSTIDPPGERWIYNDDDDDDDDDDDEVERCEITDSGADSDLLLSDEESDQGDSCSYCRRLSSTPGNRLAYCDGPNCCIKLHQRHCGGPRFVPKGSWLCAACEHKKFPNGGKMPMACEGCGSHSAGDPWTLSGGRWWHTRCVGKAVMTSREAAKAAKKKKRSQEDEQGDFDTPIAEVVSSTSSTISSTISEDVREDVWTTIMGLTNLKGICPVCGKNEINKDKGGFQCAHIDPTRKAGNHGSREENWNLVPSCGQCNGCCGQQNMLDYMATTTAMRGRIHTIAASKLYAHFKQGFMR